MTRKLGFLALGLAALAVIVQNVLFFTGGDDVEWGSDEEWELGEEEGEGDAALGALSSVSRVALRQHLQELAANGLEARSPFLTRAEAGADGSVRAVAVGGEPVLPTVTGTLTGTLRRIAWIDGAPRSEGDAVGPHRVRRIDADAVLFSGQAGSFRVPVSPAAARVPNDPDAEEGGSDETAP